MLLQLESVGHENTHYLFGQEDLQPPPGTCALPKPLSSPSLVVSFGALDGSIFQDVRTMASRGSKPVYLISLATSVTTITAFRGSSSFA
jgi:hypothetical protein